MRREGESDVHVEGFFTCGDTAYAALFDISWKAPQVCPGNLRGLDGGGMSGSVRGSMVFHHRATRGMEIKYLMLKRSTNHV